MGARYAGGHVWGKALAMLFATAVICAAQAQDGSQMVFYVASDGPRIYYVDVNRHLNEMGYHGSARANYDLKTQAATSAVAAAGTTLTMYVASDGPRIYYVDSNQHLNEMGYHGSAWANYDLKAQASSSAVAAAGTPLTMYVAPDGPRIYYVDSNLHLNEMGYRGSAGWGNYDLKAQASSSAVAAAGTPLTMYVAPDGPRIYYVDSNQHLNEMGYHGSAWGNYDLKAQASSSAVAAAGKALTMYVASDGPRIYYVDSNQHLNEMGYHGSAWANYDLKAQASSSAVAATGTPLTMYVASDGPRIYYVDSNQHLNEMGLRGSAGWGDYDLKSLASSSAVAAAGTPLTMYVASDGPRIYYVDSNQHLNEMGYRGSAGWGNYDLKSLASATAVAAAGTPLTMYVASDGPRIYYVDSNQHLNETGYHGSAWANYDLTGIAGGSMVGVGTVFPWSLKEYIYFGGRAVAVENGQP